MGQDGAGARWTVVIDDVSLVAVAIASWDCGMEYELSPDERTVVAALPGWPLAVAVAAPGVPAPHDPVPEADGRPPLQPPDTASWGPAQRRLGADEIALQWTQWREQVGDAPDPAAGTGSVAPAAGSPGEEADGDAEDSADNADSGSGAGSGGSPGSGSGAGSGSTGQEGSVVRRVLAQARAYTESPPPLGRVRSSFAPGGARTLRADGPGWSLVARTDDIAFILLDEEPGEVLPVQRGPELPGLLEALDKIAVRPL
ncbi:Integral membrane protein OS=Streptomyces fumanus OX=67302 GN=GCM10018772_67570 PE=4 SV=1 [Streptomyces fumanus]